MARSIPIRAASFSPPDADRAGAADDPAFEVHELLPWHWEKPTDQAAVAA
jgi:hypothetical protein